MNAKEALEKSQAAKAARTATIDGNVVKYIETATKRGQTCCIINGHLSPQKTQELTELGFTVEMPTDIVEKGVRRVQTLISWGDTKDEPYLPEDREVTEAAEQAEQEMGEKPCPPEAYLDADQGS